MTAGRDLTAADVEYALSQTRLSGYIAARLNRIARAGDDEPQGLGARFTEMLNRHGSRLDDADADELRAEWRNVAPLRKCIARNAGGHTPVNAIIDLLDSCDEASAVDTAAPDPLRALVEELLAAWDKWWDRHRDLPPTVDVHRAMDEVRRHLDGPARDEPQDGDS